MSLGAFTIPRMVNPSCLSAAAVTLATRPDPYAFKTSIVTALWANKGTVVVVEAIGDVDVVTRVPAVLFDCDWAAGGFPPVREKCESGQTGQNGARDHDDGDGGRCCTETPTPLTRLY